MIRTNAVIANVIIGVSLQAVVPVGMSLVGRD
jgi:hypothetical protein